MIEINDIGAARSLYEHTLFQARIPRQFWSRVASRITFSPLSVQPEPMTVTQLRAAKRSGEMNVEWELGSKGSIEISTWAQERSWTNQISFLQHWNPSIGSAGMSIVLFCADLKHAHMAAMTLAHHMLIQTYMLGERPYRVEVVRAFELQSRMTTLPSISVIPTIMRELPASTHSMVSSVLKGNHKVIAATHMSPQQFYDTLGVIPSFPYFIHRVAETCSAAEFMASIHEAPRLEPMRE